MAAVVREDEAAREILAGTPPGEVISPLLANIYLSGCSIRKRRSIQRNPRWSFVQRRPPPKAKKEMHRRSRGP